MINQPAGNFSHGRIFCLWEAAGFFKLPTLIKGRAIPFFVSNL